MHQKRDSMGIHQVLCSTSTSNLILIFQTFIVKASLDNYCQGQSMDGYCYCYCTLQDPVDSQAVTVMVNSWMVIVMTTSRTVTAIVTILCWSRSPRGRTSDIFLNIFHLALDRSEMTLSRKGF